MRYWFFDGSDVVGPFTLKELTRNKSFGESSLICPENFSDDGDHWQVAATFAEFAPFFQLTRNEEENTSTLDQELDTLLQERSPLAFDETPSEGPKLQIPKKPAKPGPIEDYFNRVKEEDLGDILGIPNPNDNSDMDLAHALEKQLAKTSSTRREKQEMPADEQTAKELTQAAATHHVATATEVFGTQTTAPVKTVLRRKQRAPLPEVTTPSLPTVEPVTLPVLTQDPLETAPQAAKESPEEQISCANTVQEEPHTQPAVQDPVELVPNRPQQTTPHEPEETEETAQIIPDPAVLRHEKVEVNSIRARLKETQEMKDFLHETQNSHLKQQTDTQRRVIVMLLAVVAITAGLLLALQMRAKPTHTPPPQPAPQAAPMPASELLEEVPPLPAPAPDTTAKTQVQKAISIVQNYALGNKRGTLGTYLKRVYKTQLAQGYVGAWEAEPLYKNTYIVKYRLTKTRKEPIIYVFQADVAQGKLTGALNNISLDLVGKIN